MADYTVPSVPQPGPLPNTTYELPNFIGELFFLIPAEVPFLAMGGGLTGGKGVDSTEFTWQVTDNAEAAVNNSKLEAADPTDESIIRQFVKNVVEIHQESVAVGYSKQGATGNLGASDVGNAGTPGAGADVPPARLLGTQPVQNEISHQLMLKINKISRDVERSFLEGVFALPTDNQAARQTRGILTAITIHAETFAVSLRDSFNALLIGMYEDELTVAPLINPVIFVNGSTKVKFSNEYTNNLGLADRSRTIGGVNVETIVTDFGTFGIVLDRYMPTDELLLADMSVVAPCFMPIEGKGHFFTEPLAKTGAYDRVQIYGEIGLEYGPEQFHGKIVSIT
jgi:hypothetical protein